jgi:hypothetical protein
MEWDTFRHGWICGEENEWNNEREGKEGRAGLNKDCKWG